MYKADLDFIWNNEPLVFPLHRTRWLTFKPNKVAWGKLKKIGIFWASKGRKVR